MGDQDLLLPRSVDSQRSEGPPPEPDLGTEGVPKLLNVFDRVGGYVEEGHELHAPGAEPAHPIAKVPKFVKQIDVRIIRDEELIWH